MTEASGDSVDQALQDFEYRWQQDERPSLQQVIARLRDPAAAESVALYCEFVAIDLWHRWRASPEAAREESDGLPAKPLLEAYAAVYPAACPVHRLPASLVKEEYRVRRMAGEAIDKQAHATRFRGTDEATLLKALDSVDYEIDLASTLAAAHASSVVDHTASHSKPVQPYEPGQRIAQFELRQRIAAGGFGAVWRAWDDRLSREVAVKLPRRVDLEPREVKYFLAESRSAAQLKHPNIVPVFESGVSGDTPYIVSELVDGKPLSEINFRGDWNAIASTAAQLAEALHHAHSQGVVHRDIKPANILIEPDGRPRITDFGLARHEGFAHSATAEGAVFGTLAYMPPEQARGMGQHADGRSDVYSLGVVLFELLEGALPFETDALARQMRGPATQRPPKFTTDVPLDLQTVCLKCLEADPGDRYATAETLASDLEAYLDGRPITARPLGPGERLTRWRRARPLTAGLVATTMFLAVLLVSAVFLSTWRLGSLSADISSANSAAAAERVASNLVRYASTLSSAHQAFSDGDAGRAERLLTDASQQLPNSDRPPFAHRLLDVWLAKPGLQAIEAHTGAVLAATIKGGAVSTIGADGHLRQWDAETGEGLGDWRLGKAGPIELACFHPQEPQAVIATDRRLLGIGTGESEPAHEFEVPLDAPITNLGYSNSGGHIYAVIGGQELRVWKATDGEQVLRLPRDLPLLGAAVLDQERVALLQGSGGLDVVSLDAGRLVSAPRAGDAAVAGRFASAPGAAFAVAATTDGRLLRVNPDGGLAPIATNPAEGLTALALSGRGRLLAAGARTGAVTVLSPGAGPPIGLVGHRRRVTCLAFDQSGQRLVSGDAGGLVILWDTATGSGARKLHHALAPVVHGVAPISATELVSAEASSITPSGYSGRSQSQGALNRWGNSRGDDRRLEPTLSYSDAAVSPDGKWLAISAGSPWTPGRIEVIDLEARSRRVAWEDVVGSAHSIAFGPAGRLAVASGRSVEGGPNPRQDADSRLVVLAPDLSAVELDIPLPGRVVSDLAFSPDGGGLVIASYREPAPLLLDLDSAAETPPAPIANPSGEGVSALSFVGPGRVAYATFNEQNLAKPGSVLLLNADVGETRELGQHELPVTSITPVSDNRFVTASLDGELCWWSTDRPAALHRHRVGSPVMATRQGATPEELLMITAQPGARLELGAWRRRDDTFVLQRNYGVVGGVAMATDLQRGCVYVGEALHGSLNSVGLESGALQLMPSAEVVRITESALMCVATSLESLPGLAVTGDREGVVALWDINRHQEIDATTAAGAPVIEVGISNDGAFAAALLPGAEPSQRSRGRLRLFRIEPPGHRLAPYAPAALRGVDASAIAFSPSGAVLAIGVAGGCLLYDLAGDEEVVRYAIDSIEADAPTAIAFSPSGDHLAFVTPTSIVAFNTESGKVVASRRFESRRPAALAFSPDGTTLAAVLEDGVRLLAFPELLPLADLPSPLRRLTAACFSLDGDTLYASGVGVNLGEGVCCWEASR
ncbi:MAG: protein kinase [Planctomycetota bacterium]